MMALPDDLLAQSYILATLDRGRPKQANLRRAISSAYYGVFHLLVTEAAQSFIPKRPKGLPERVSRSFSHTELRQACASFVRKPIPVILAHLLQSPISNELSMLASTFISLQEARHSADYDLSLVLTRSTVLARLEDAEGAFWAWKCIRNTEEATVFLAALAFGARWSK